MQINDYFNDLKFKYFESNSRRVLMEGEVIGKLILTRRNEISFRTDDFSSIRTSISYVITIQPPRTSFARFYRIRQVDWLVYIRRLLSTVTRKKLPSIKIISDVVITRTTLRRHTAIRRHEFFRKFRIECSNLKLKNFSDYRSRFNCVQLLLIHKVLSLAMKF